MNTPLLVVADTTPLNYLVLTGRGEILGALFGLVLVPRAVKEPPAWLRVVDVEKLDATLGLGDGENEAISLAIERQANVVLLDERKGRAAAKARGLLTLGTLNLINLGDEAGLLDGVQALRDLRQTSFRAPESLWVQFETTMQERREVRDNQA